MAPSLLRAARHLARRAALRILYTFHKFGAKTLCIIAT